ncbi:DUF1801 domain-containing protein [Sphingomonas gilva]|uniref:DUF1801 domain-containing protein n=1 Tax=Sphingomonas gilva TaxID=2305907 RepID=A0A396RYH1_9SPHN|nr:DUF1801 domain-containing protein [Sphingomonas gilva]RHW18771.1 DUF1801 domain-containing protein [Sphingomonas gilva]
MAENKTKPTNASVAAFIEAVEPAQRREDAKTVCALMERLSGEPPVLWGPSIIGFGTCHYRYESGREGDMPRIGFSPRKAQLVLYIVSDFPRYEALMAKLGKYTTGKSCLYIKKLADVDMAVLEELIVASLADTAERYPT